MLKASAPANRALVTPGEGGSLTGGAVGNLVKRGASGVLVSANRLSEEIRDVTSNAEVRVA